MHPLPESTWLGKLRIAEVLDYYDGPRLFTASTLAGNLFLAYFSDQTAHHEVWLYIPISPARLSTLKTGVLDLREALVNPEDGVIFRLKIDSRGHTTTEAITSEKLDPEALPPEDDYLQGFDEQFQAAPVPPKKKHALQETTVKLSIRIKQKPSKLPDAGLVAKVFDYWSQLFQTVSEAHHGLVRLFPQVARQGSFEVDFGANDPEKALRTCDTLRRVFERGTKPPISKSKSPEIPATGAPALLGLTDLIIRNDLELVIAPIFAGKSQWALTINDGSARPVHAFAEENVYSALDSTDVPQADDLGKVVKILPYLGQINSSVVEKKLGIVRRQVLYYTHAARVLGLVTEFAGLTAAGEHLLRLDASEQNKILAFQFERSRCGAAWIKWNEGKTLRDIDPETAEDFLLNCAQNLSENTTRRRAQTLIAWYEFLRPVR